MRVLLGCLVAAEGLAKICAPYGLSPNLTGQPFDDPGQPSIVPQEVRFVLWVGDDAPEPMLHLIPDEGRDLVVEESLASFFGTYRTLRPDPPFEAGGTYTLTIDSKIEGWALAPMTFIAGYEDTEPPRIRDLTCVHGYGFADEDQDCGICTGSAVEFSADEIVDPDTPTEFLVTMLRIRIGGETFHIVPWLCCSCCVGDLPAGETLCVSRQVRDWAGHATSWSPEVCVPVTPWRCSPDGLDGVVGEGDAAVPIRERPTCDGGPAPDAPAYEIVASGRGCACHVAASEPPASVPVLTFLVVCLVGREARRKRCGPNRHGRDL